MAAPQQDEAILTRLDSLRRELLDLDLGNPLLNFRLPAGRGVRLVGHDFADLYDRLVTRGKTMRLLPLGGRRTTATLQADHAPAELQKRCFNTADAAQTYLQEQGIHVLYLAAGLVTWTPAGQPEPCRAPLLLIPITLTQSGLDTPFEVSCTGGDISLNLSLQARLRQDAGLELPTLPPPETPPPADFWSQVARALPAGPGWGVDPEQLHLALFSFSRLLLYEDLDPQRWPAGRPPAARPLVRGLLDPAGFPATPPAIPDDAWIDRHLPLEELHLVFDADSSQLAALADVDNGRTLVIQGPPGTGKSQTIANLIAQAIGRGQTVLFVAEKMAALEVVHRRLSQIGLGDALLELHSHKTTRSGLAAELEKILARGRPVDAGSFPELDELRRLRERLNSHAEAMNRPVGRSGRSPYDLLGEQIAAAQPLQPHLSLPDGAPELPPDSPSWPAADFETVRSQVAALESFIRQTGRPDQHPLQGSGLTVDARHLAEPLRSAAAAARTRFDELSQALHTLFSLLAIPPPPQPEGVDAALEFARELVHLPLREGIRTADPRWRTAELTISPALAAGERLITLRERFGPILIPEAWEQDVLPLRAAFVTAGDGLLRHLNREYRQARRQLAALCRQGCPDEPAEQLALVDAILEHRRLHPQAAGSFPLLAELFGPQWNGWDSPWAQFAWLGQALAQIHHQVAGGQLPEAVLGRLGQPLLPAERQPLAEQIDQVSRLLRAAEEARGRLANILRLPAGWGREISPAELVALCGRLLEGQTLVTEIVTYNRLCAPLVERRMGPFLDFAAGWPAAGQQLTNLLTWCWSDLLLRRARAERPPLASFDPAAHETALARFRELDVDYLRSNRRRLAFEHWQRLPRDKIPGRVGQFKEEIARRRGLRPIRELITLAGPVLQTIKPVFMMSPLSVAAYLPPGAVEFDLVIFDEASQVRPADALGALLRGRQAVVVGDDKQLPPTPFFRRLAGEQDPPVPDEEEAGWVDENGSGGQLESILDLFIAQNAPLRQLRWHYRSQHESLIALSNELLYDRRLVLFPSPDAGRREVGLRLHHLPETVYERGGSRTNPKEAEAVAGRVLAHARQAPEQTLGVVTFNLSQREAILAAIERQLRRADPDTAEFFKKHPHEPFFVKNIENVQGDERDVILISFGYGRDENGRISHYFGPLNHQGGERRLNVMITRARRRCEVFTNFLAGDLDLARSQAAGVAALKKYLEYAVSGRLADLPPLEKREVDRFSRVVLDTLRPAGRPATPRVGLGGVEIDIALAAPDDPERYLLGLEIDGRDYARARSASDRDRLQQIVLTRLGWRLLRVWSGEWPGRAAAAAQELLVQIETEVNEDGPPEPPAAPAREPIRRYDPEKPAELSLPPYEVTPRPQIPDGGEIPDNLVAQLAAIVAAEGPLHEALLFDDIFAAPAGLAGLFNLSRIKRKRLKEELAAAPGIRIEGSFFWPAARKTPPLRSWQNLPSNWRRLEFICEEELAGSLIDLLQRTQGLEPENLFVAAGRYLGFAQLSQADLSRLSTVTRDLFAGGRLAIAGRWIAAAGSETTVHQSGSIAPLIQKAVQGTQPRANAYENLGAGLPRYPQLEEIYWDAVQLNWQPARGDFALLASYGYVFDPKTQNLDGKRGPKLGSGAGARLSDDRFAGFTWWEPKPNTTLGMQPGEIIASLRYDLLREQFFVDQFFYHHFRINLRDILFTAHFVLKTSQFFIGLRLRENETPAYHPVDLTTGQIDLHAPQKIDPLSQPISLAESTLSEMLEEDLADTFLPLLEREAPLHVAELGDRFRRSLSDLFRVANNDEQIEKAIARMIDRAGRHPDFTRSGDFIYPKHWDNLAVRSRQRLGKRSTLRRPERIAPQELEAAMHFLWSHFPDLTPEEMPQAVADLLGLYQAQGERYRYLHEIATAAAAKRRSG